MPWFETDWYFCNSEGVEVTGGEGVNVGISWGSFFIRNQLPNSVVRLRHGSFAAGAGIGLPMNIDVSTDEYPSIGIGRILGNNRHFLDPSDFEGWCSMAGVQVAAVGGLTSLSVYFGTPLPGFFWDARAWGKIAGTTLGLQGGAGGMFYFGRISR